MRYSKYPRPSSALLCLLASGIFLCASFVLIVTRSSAKETVHAKTSEPSDSALTWKGQVTRGYGKLPLSFEPNLGQADRRVRFSARGQGYGLFLTSDETVVALRSSSPTTESNAGRLLPRKSKVLRIKLLGAERRSDISGLDELPGKLNYFIGNNSRKWRRDIPAYSKVRYSNVYPGIDLVYHGQQGQLEYDFVIAPGRSPARIKMAFKGMESIHLEPDGTLVLRTSGGDVRQPKPIAYQEINGQRREVTAGYVVEGNKVSFKIGSYDRNEPLIIDPVLIYSSFLGGTSSEQGLGIAVDAQGSAYLTGSTFSMDFPVVGPYQNALNNSADAFVAKVNPAGTALTYSTYLGGDNDEIGNAIAVDAQGSAYVVGVTVSGTFPTTPGAFQVSKDGDIDGFVTKLSPSGSSLVYSTFLGGDRSDTAYGIAVTTDGRAHVVGRTDSTRFLTLPFPTPRNGSPSYKSTDSGAQWTPTSSGLTSSAVNGFGLDPSTANTLYAATNAGVFKSTDAGANWSLTGTGSPSTSPQSSNVIVIDPGNPNIIYAAGAFEGVYKSIDGGNNYVVKNDGFQVPFVSALAIVPTATATLYAGTPFGMYKTTNGADGWVAINNGFFPSEPRVNEVAIDPTNPSVVYAGTNNGMFKTTNGGALWTSINSGPISSFTQITYLAIDPVNPSILYAGLGFASVIYKTTDGGATWTSISLGSTSPGINSLAIDHVTPATIYAATTNVGIIKSTNGGLNWSASNTGLANKSINAVALATNNPAIIYAGANIGADAFAVKLASSGSTLEYLINFGGNESDEARGVALGSDGTAYVVGSTSSANFPVVNAFQSSAAGATDAFVTKLNSSGNGFVYSTYLGGSGSEFGRGVALSAGKAYVAGTTSSPNFPVVNPIMPAPATGSDAFVTKFNTSGSAPDFSTCLGGSGTDQGLSIAVNSAGDAYVTGFTASSNFPTVSAIQATLGGASDAFVTKISSAGTALIYSTYLGGNSSDQGNGIAVDASGNAYVTGTTSSVNFPTVGAFQPTNKNADAFVAKLGAEVDVSISKTDSRDPVMVNNAVTYTLTVTNSGPSPATGVTVTDVLPSGMNFGSATPTQGTCAINNLTVTCALGSLAVASSATVNIAVTPTATGLVSNSASVTVTEPDRNTANNTAVQTTTVSASPSISGHVRDTDGNGVTGVLMTLSGGQSATQQTDANGFYQFAELPSGGNYTVTPSKTAFSFEPPAHTFNNLSADQTANFVASSCAYTLSPASQSFAAAGGSGSVNVTSLNGCPWTATSSADWITVTSGASGVGNGTVNFTVSPTSVPRAGRISIAERNFVIYQESNSCSAPSFSIATYSVGGNPTRILTADLNGDAHLDLLTRPGIGSTASVLLNNGMGAFTASEFGLGLEPQGLALSDLNGDGKRDVAITSYNFPFVRIFFNNGNGGFGQSVDIPFTSQGQSPLTRDLFSSDLNSDGKADLLVYTPGAAAIQVMLGNGTGGFTQLPPITVTNFDYPIGVADVNDNGVPDLIFGGGGDNDRNLSVRLGDGAGGVGLPIISSGIRVTLYVATSDFDGDGKLDIAASTIIPAADSTPSNPTFTNGVSILKGDGSGHFVALSSYDSGGGSLPNVTVADFNNDAKPDIAFVKGGSKVTVLPGDGLGGLGTAIEVDTGASDSTGGNFGVTAGDFDGDFRRDIAVADYSRGVSVARNTCASGPSISGGVTDSNTRGLPGVVMTLSGAQTRTVTTDGGGNYFFGNLTAGANYVVTPSRDHYRFNPATRNIDNINGLAVADFVGTPITVQFTQGHYLLEEFTPSLQVSVSRSGDLSGITTVDYRTVNGTASDRTDYTFTQGTLRFEPGEALKSFNVLFTNDTHIEGFEDLTLSLSNANGALLNPPGSFLPINALVEIRDNDFDVNAPNPIEDSRFFVRQHYHDFLNREPDDAGLNFWADQIDSCTTVPCREVKRINVSAAFFLSIEFQQTGYLVYRVYKASYGDLGPPTFPNQVPVIRLPEFLPDTQRIGRDVQVGIGNWEQQLESNKTAYMQEFVQRQRFLNEFPLSLTPAQFVDKLNFNAGGVLSQLERDQLVAELAGAAGMNQGRASVLRKVAEDADMNRNETNRAFVQMQYFGYLRRNPNDPPDSDFAGWQFWLTKLNEFNGNFINAEMVKAFITSGEYTQRFGR